MRTHHQSRLLTVALVTALAAIGAAQDLTVPNTKDSLKFAVIGDSGTGNSDQYRVASRLAEVYKRYPFEFVLMLGDNMYGSESTSDFVRKFERPYKPLLDAGVKFYASLGNHDSPNQRMYKLFNMGGERFYTFKPKDGVRFFALDSNYMDQQQLQWLAKELAASGSDWKIMFFHYPIYSSGGRHGSDEALRDQLEPLFLKHGVDVVLAGHEHFYERLKPQKGIHYFISGGAGKLRRGDVGGVYTEKAFDQGFHFMVFEIAGDQMHFQTISDQAKTVDSGIVTRRRVDTAAAPSQPAAPAMKPVPPQDKPAGAAGPGTVTAKPGTGGVTPAAAPPKP
jgi:predicted phosphodiesterase